MRPNNHEPQISREQDTVLQGVLQAERAGIAPLLATTRQPDMGGTTGLGMCTTPIVGEEAGGTITATGTIAVGTVAFG